MNSDGQNSESRKVARCFFVLLGFVSLVPLGCLLFDLWRYPYLISGGLAMRIVAAGLLARGELPYVDFWDWSQPIVFESLKYLHMLCTALGAMGVSVIPASFIPLCIFCLIIGSLILLAAIAWQALTSVDSAEAKQEIQSFALACAFGLALTLLIARFDFGELQYVLLLAVAPWLFLRWLAHNKLPQSTFAASAQGSSSSLSSSSSSSSKKISRCQMSLATILAVLVGIIAGAAACSDIPYLFVFVIVELVLLLQSHRWRSLFSLEWLTFILMIAINFLCLTNLQEPVHTAFWQWTMPLKWLNYSIVDPAIVAPLSSPNRVDVVYCLVAAALLAFLFSKKNSCFAPLTGLLLSGLGLYMLEGQGFSHDFTVAIFAITTIFIGAAIIAVRQGVNWFAQLAPQSKNSVILQSPLAFQSVLVVLVLTSTTAVWCSLDHDRSKLQDYMSLNITKGNLPLDLALEKTSKVNDSVTLLSPYVEPAYPLLLFSGRKPGGYLLWSRPLWLFKWISDNSTFSGPMKDFQTHTWSNIESEIAQQRTDLFIASDDQVLNTFDREKFFRALRKGYLEVDTTGDYFSLGNHQPHEYCGSNPQFRFFVKRSK